MLDAYADPRLIYEHKIFTLQVVIKCKLIYCINSKLLNTASTQFQYNKNSVKFQNFNVNTVSTQYQHNINH